ncbi:MAG: arnT 1 [Cytophagaceae bacterium]|jgi:4-amino-4-deoxy-L-arabinose transferase-like glycosyltransferase|nr:arnT 1 [Cytophagaceae bacterium]
MQKKYYLLILMLLVTAMEFWHLGSQPVKEYDEARYAANAFEMMENKDYVNLHYLGQPDTWVARPPVKAWLIIGGYKLLGYNEWGLRLSSGLAILAFFFFAFRLINLYLKEAYAFLACLMLISVKGIIGFHVGKNADMDAELIALITIATYFFLRYVDFKDNKSAWWSGLFLGLSFWVKTTACFYYIPGLILYLLVTRRFTQTLRSKHTWIGTSIFVLMILSWFILLQVKGCAYDCKAKDSFHTYSNSWETMLIYDTWDRFTASTFDKHPVEPNRAFFIHSIDSIFNVWNYFFYAGLVLFLFNRYSPVRKQAFLDSPFYRICTLSLCILTPIILLLTFGMHKLPWYTSPSLLFLAILATYAVHEIATKIPYTYWIVSGVLIFTTTRHFLFLEEEIQEKNEVYFLLENKPLWQDKQTVYYVEPLRQNMYVYLLWQGKKIAPFQPQTQAPNGIVMGDESAYSAYANRLEKLVSSQEEKHKRLLFIARIKP